MRKEMPEWLKKHYNRLWARYRHQEFTFKDATKGLGVSRAMTIKTLWELEQRGFVNKERSEVDYRARVYRLISPEDISFATGLYSLVEKERLEKQSLTEKLAFIDDRLPYMLTGSYAAYRYHRYLNPTKVFEIKTKPQDEGKWIAFLTDARTRVFIGEIIETRKISNYAKLLHSAVPIDSARTKTEEGYYIEKLEFLFMGLLKRQTQTSIMEATAIIVQNKDRLKWNGKDGVINLARDLGLSRRLGFLLDAINYEAHVPVVNHDIIRRIEKDVKGKSDEVFPGDAIFQSRFRDLRNKLAHEALLTRDEMKEFKKMKERFEGYRALSEKWGFEVVLPREIIQKILEDLGAKFGKK